MTDHIRTHKKRFTIKRILLAFLMIIALGLVGARIYLPYWVKDYVNAQIAALDGYGGAVNDIDIHLWRGAYQINGLNIYKTDGSTKTPFVKADTIDLSLEWRALFHGRIVAEIDLYSIDLNFTKNQTGEGADWAEFADRLTPFDINRMAVHSGKIAYIDYTATPNVNVYIDGIDGLVTNLRDVEDKNSALPSDLSVSGTSVGEGKLSVTGKMNIIKNIPDFDMSMKLENASLLAFNDYARAFAAIDFERGTIGVFSELAAVNGRVSGYVKAVGNDIAMINIAESGPLHALWESTVAFFVELFENQREDQFALRLPIEGSLENPERDTWSAFVSIFQNAFLGAFTKNTDGNVNFYELLQKE